jgi:YD repeat-containing protein
VNSVTDVFGQVVSYQYDANSNRTQMSLNGATNATYQYDIINRLTQLTDNAALNVTFVYGLASRVLTEGESNKRIVLACEAGVSIKPGA